MSILYTHFIPTFWLVFESETIKKCYDVLSGFFFFFIK